MKHLRTLVAAIAVSTVLVANLANAAVISIVGSRFEGDSIQAGFESFGDTVTRYTSTWNSYTDAQLADIFSADIVWDVDVFGSFDSNVANFMTSFVNGNGGLWLTGERACCETHNTSIQNFARVVTGDTGLIVGGLGRDLFGHSFSTSPTTILTGPNDIRGQSALHNGPGQVVPTGGISSNACFTVSEGNICTAAAWGPDELVGNSGRLIVYGDVNSQPSLVSENNGDQFENMREFLLAGFSGGVDVCITNPNLPGCTPPNSANAPSMAVMIGLSVLIFGLRRSLRK